MKIFTPALLKIAIALLLILYLVLPTSIQLLKIICLISLTFFSIFSARNRLKIVYFKNIFVRMGLSLLILLPFYIVSVVSGNPGALPLFKSQILLPSITIFCAFNLTRHTNLKSLVLICSLSSILILVLQILLFLVPQYLSFITFRSGSIQADSLVAITNLSYAGLKTQYFLLPFLSVIVVLNNRYKTLFINEKLAYSAIIAALFSLILGVSGSSIATLLYTTLVIYAISLYYLLASFSSGKIRLSLALVSIVIIVFIPFLMIDNFFLVEHVLNRLLLSPNQIIDVGDQIRYEQEIELIAQFTKNPLFGSSVGLDNGMQRGEYAWASELLYHSLLSQFGLIGFISLLNFGGVYMFYTIPLLIKSFTSKFHYDPNLLIIRSSYIIGLINVIIISSKNPNLASFENCFVFYLPFFYTSMLVNKSSYQA